MQFWIGVENFAKIEKAKICVNQYTVLVGQNNSGKTFLMQLIQGVTEKVTTWLEKDVLEIFLEKESESSAVYKISEKNIGSFVEYINQKIDREKEEIIYDIFKKNIAVDKLYIDLALNEDVIYEIDIFKNKDIDLEVKGDATGEISRVLKTVFNEVDPESPIAMMILSKIGQKDSASEILMLSFGADKKESYFGTIKSALKYVFEAKNLFLPASRTGLLMLYRDFFANRADTTVSYVIKNDKFEKAKDNSVGLTQPVYNFLRFLQTYSEDDERKHKHIKELAFFEDKLIEGHINMDKKGILSYNSKMTPEGIPMYLASSMINEVAPIVLAITGAEKFDGLVIDEVESSLHPEKQQELVRFLNRLNNGGMSLIVSTHSDTFVSKVNNLYGLSKYIEESGNYEILKKFDLEKEDLVDIKRLFVYEFINKESGKSVVKEIIPNDNLGFQFDHFTKSAMKLYNEAVKVEEYNR